MHDHPDAAACLEQVEKMFNHFLALYAVDCILWPPALERVAADLDALHEGQYQGSSSPAPGGLSLQRRLYMDD
jgi:hypothetical protein